jgi:hypothetical protein
VFPRLALLLRRLDWVVAAFRRSLRPQRSEGRATRAHFLSLSLPSDKISSPFCARDTTKRSIHLVITPRLVGFSRNLEDMLRVMKSEARMSCCLRAYQESDGSPLT